jgi:hypothetical protein
MAKPISVLMGRTVVGNAARLNGICSHAHQLIGLEWSVGVATQGFLPQDIGVVCQERRIQQPASVREERLERLSEDNRRGCPAQHNYVDFWSRRRNRAAWETSDW